MEELWAHIGRRWYSYGWQSPEIFYKRLRSKYRPWFRARMMWQRARHGYSVEDCWGLDYHLAHVTVGGVKRLREWAHSYPAELGNIEAWDAILARIEGGFQAWLDEDGWFADKPEAEAKFKDGMALYAHWFGALWD
jgi:hypothetical protein